MTISFKEKTAILIKELSFFVQCVLKDVAALSAERLKLM